jgi:hypothetical protein
MPTMADLKNQRDIALEEWRCELRALNGIQPGSAEWEEQCRIIRAARACYDQAVADYIDTLAAAETHK